MSTLDFEYEYESNLYSMVLKYVCMRIQYHKLWVWFDSTHLFEYPLHEYSATYWLLKQKLKKSSFQAHNKKFMKKNLFSKTYQSVSDNRRADDELKFLIFFPIFYRENSNKKKKTKRNSNYERLTTVSAVEWSGASNCSTVTGKLVVKQLKRVVVKSVCCNGLFNTLLLLLFLFSNLIRITKGF